MTSKLLLLNETMKGVDSLLFISTGMLKKIVCQLKIKVLFSLCALNVIVLPTLTRLYFQASKADLLIN